jgi:acyl carrier protein
MTKTEIYAALAEIFEDVFGRSDLVLKPGTTARDIAGWDSIRQIDIVLSVEQRFQIKLTTRDLDRLTCVGDLVKVISRSVPR